MLPVAILAGGKGTRLYPITQAIPKALVPVAGVPFILRQLLYLRSQGVRRVVVCVGTFGDMIRDLIGDGAKFGVTVEYSADGPTPLGTGGALKAALPLLGDNFLVLYGDSYVQVPLREFLELFEGRPELGLMTVFRNRDRWVASNVKFRRGKVVEYRKTAACGRLAFVDYGLSALKSAALRTHLDGTTGDLGTVFEALARAGQLAGVRMRRRFYEIGTPKGLQQTESLFFRRRRPP
jgi:N-acetyl-alpha-D-muramate 1-phosphate uridylyltransferase